MQQQPVIKCGSSTLAGKWRDRMTSFKTFEKFPSISRGFIVTWIVWKCKLATYYIHYSKRKLTSIIDQVEIGVKVNFKAYKGNRLSEITERYAEMPFTNVCWAFWIGKVLKACISPMQCMYCYFARKSLLWCLPFFPIVNRCVILERTGKKALAFYWPSSCWYLTHRYYE